MRVVQPGEFYRHFKGNYYQIITLAHHSETDENLVVYQALYGEYKVCARPYDMFVSEVDREKYPNAVQKYRFELIKSENFGNTEAKPEKTAEAESKEVIPAEIELNQELAGVNPDLLAFLELDTLAEKLEMLRDLRKRIDDRLLDSIAASLDIVVDDGPLPQRYQEVLNCLETMEHFECSRFR